MQINLKISDSKLAILCMHIQLGLCDITWPKILYYTNNFTFLFVIELVGFVADCMVLLGLAFQMHSLLMFLSSFETKTLLKLTQNYFVNTHCFANSTCRLFECQKNLSTRKISPYKSKKSIIILVFNLHTI